MSNSKSLESSIEFMFDRIAECKELDQLENNKRMIDFFVTSNAENDKMPFIKNYLLGALAMKSKTLNL
jgi:hypothetical protein